jgi:DNA-binding NarL/FixJ family response regulator
VSKAEKRSTIKQNLSQRELEVLSLLTMGKSDHQIAEQLFITDVTVRAHINHILKKLFLKNRVELALYGLSTDVVKLHDIRLSDEDLQ